jgi:YjjW family glycine radical enzyme activase
VKDVYGLVTSTIPFSLVDGPGNRFVIFLQGCNFDCLACHNPHTIHVCHHCGECVGACRSGALTFDGRSVDYDPERCSQCDDCLRACGYRSTPKAGSRSLASLIAEIRKAVPFLSGVTVSGGEATQQAEFVLALFQALRAEPALARLTRFIDSNGAASVATWERLAPHFEGAMIDLKAYADGLHQRLTGASNASVRLSIEHLARIGKLHEVRLLLIPGVNDAEVAATARYLFGIDPQLRVKLIGFRRHGTRSAAHAWNEPDGSQLAAYAAQLRAAGLTRIEVV